MMPSSRWLQLSYVCGSYDRVFLLGALRIGARSRPSVSDPLEPRVALSTTAAAPIAARCRSRPGPLCPALTDLNGMLTGTLRTTTRSVGLETLTTVELSGSGRVGSLGEAKVSGTLRWFNSWQEGGT